MASSVTQIWYSLRLNDKDYCLVISMLQELIEASNLDEPTKGTMQMNREQFQKLVEVWRTWLDLSSRQGDCITKARNRGFTNFDDRKGMELYVEELPKEHKVSTSDWFANGILLPEKSRKKPFSRKFYTHEFRLPSKPQQERFLLQNSVMHTFICRLLTVTVENV